MDKVYIVLDSEYPKHGLLVKPSEKTVELTSSVMDRLIAGNFRQVSVPFADIQVEVAKIDGNNVTMLDPNTMLAHFGKNGEIYLQYGEGKGDFIFFTYAGVTIGTDPWPADLEQLVEDISIGHYPEYESVKHFFNN